MDLIVENVRCFAGTHVAPLAPLTLLVGENSSGKSTFVAMARLAWDAMSRWDAIDFNEEPFRLGAFDDIATRTRSGVAATFAVGYRFPPKTLDDRLLSSTHSEDVAARIVFAGRVAQPAVQEWSVRCGRYEVTHRASATREQSDPILTVKGPLTDLSFTALDLPMPPSIMAISSYWRFFRMRMTSEAASLFGKDEGEAAAREDLDVLDRLLSTIEVALRGGRPYACAPIRTRPARTYDPLTDKPTPEGDHVPMMLAKLTATKPDDPQFRNLLAGLHKFGAAAGLFNAIDVRRMGGDEANNPFQVRVGMDGGPHFNLVDVGYGVSQVLPILVDAITNKHRMLLLQQPEVHLHPRAQAELGSFFLSLVSEHRKAPILIETHSDYLLDRVRMDIRDKKGTAATDVVILYFARNKDGGCITPIWIDDYGNLINAPAGYRDFFLAEERRFLQG